MNKPPAQQHLQTNYHHQADRTRLGSSAQSVTYAMHVADTNRSAPDKQQEPAGSNVSPEATRKRRLISPIASGTPTGSGPAMHHQSYSPGGGHNQLAKKHMGNMEHVQFRGSLRQPSFQGEMLQRGQIPAQAQVQNSLHQRCNQVPLHVKSLQQSSPLMCRSSTPPLHGRGASFAEENGYHSVVHEGNNSLWRSQFMNNNGKGEQHSPKSSNPLPQQPSRPNCEINSVREWHDNYMKTGSAPSANKCVPLKSPIPSRFWGDVEKTKDAFVPDFHRLVNFPDYLPKNRPPPGDGMRCCVMCGLQRLCTASTSKNNLKNRLNEKSNSPNHTFSSNAVLPPPSPTPHSGPTHIIPRQNKGLCTACDVTVWVVAQTGLEIKWCKGCKNFRPWAAFGDKGLATKCVRCRDRQREKYALQKENLKQKRQLIGSKENSKDISDTNHEIDSGVTNSEVERERSASGLSHLLAATNQVTG